MTVKKLIKSFLRRRGYNLNRINLSALGYDPFEDMRRITGDEEALTLFDVGANNGQTISAFRAHFSSPVIHAFEPSPLTFQTLRQNTSRIPDLHLNNCALGSSQKYEVLLERSQSTLSSILVPGKDYCWEDAASAQTSIPVEPLDNYCDLHEIRHINVLKSDTQGFDLEVLRGAADLLKNHRVQLVFVEMNFSELYAGMPQFDDIYLFLKEYGFVPVCFYNQSFREHRLGWLDGLFVDPLSKPTKSW